MAKSSTIIGPILLYEIFSNKIECSNEKNGPLSTYLPGKSSHYIRYPNSQNIAINYDTFSLNPKWAVEHLYRDSFNEKCETKKRPPFHSEPLILEQFRVILVHYLFWWLWCNYRHIRKTSHLQDMTEAILSLQTISSAPLYIFKPLIIRILLTYVLLGSFQCNIFIIQYFASGYHISYVAYVR